MEVRRWHNAPPARKQRQWRHSTGVQWVVGATRTGPPGKALPVPPEQAGQGHPALPPSPPGASSHAGSGVRRDTSALAGLAGELIRVGRQVHNACTSIHPSVCPSIHPEGGGPGRATEGASGTRAELGKPCSNHTFSSLIFARPLLCFANQSSVEKCLFQRLFQPAARSEALSCCPTAAAQQQQFLSVLSGQAFAPLDRN